MRIHHVGAVLVAAMLLTACNSVQSAGNSLLSSAGIGSSSQSALTGLMAGNANAVQTYATMTAINFAASSVREAQAAERQQAEARAAKKLESMPPATRTEMSQNKTYVAVKVDSPDQTEKVMVVDPQSGKSVDGRVYERSRGPGVTQVKAGDKIDLGEYDAVYVD
jgi:predicted small secreted protein